jgi:tryptophanyl-tRNA synthetase
VEKIRKAKTDSFPMPQSILEITEGREEIANLLEIYCGFSGDSMEKAIGEFSQGSTAMFKNKLTGVIVESLDPISDKIEKLLKNPGELENIFKEGKRRAEHDSQPQLKIVCQKILGDYSL